MIRRLRDLAAPALWATTPGPARRARRRGPGPWDWLADPRSAVLLILAAILILGGGRRWLRASRARRAVERLDDPAVTPEQVEEMADHGRAGLMDLFRLLGTAEDPRVREAAGRALAALWADDQLVPEEEKAVARRGFEVRWRARRRYPRDLRAPIPIEVEYGIPFLRDGKRGVRPDQLEWSHRIRGAERARLEAFSPWEPGPGRVRFLIEPSDFPGRGPQRLVLEARMRTRGLTSAWELDLPHMPLSFEFDPNLAPDALLALPDAARGEAIAVAVGLRPSEAAEGEARFLDLGDDLALRDPPVLAVTTPLPCDLAHALSVEFEGIPGRFPAGEVVLSGQGADPAERPTTRMFPIGPIEGLPPGAFDRVGPVRLRAVLATDSNRGWGDPDIRSIWPEAIVTDWHEARVIRS